ncbi:MAG: sulfatase-like hydrolase/transferase [Kiritimatiellia bacterium]
MNKPNILLITTDQQRFDTIQALGNGSIYTPHLNWLVDRGITFTRCYADSPICMPARATIMTGRCGYSTGLVGNSNDTQPMVDHPTLPGLLTAHGYQTRAQGKMHFFPIRANYGFEHMELPMDYYRERHRNPEGGLPKEHGVGENEVEPVISTVDEVHSLTYWTVRRSIDFLETRDDTRPFFLWTSFTKPHPPWDPCANYWALYRDMAFPPCARGDWSQSPEDVPPGLMEPTWKLNNMYRLSGQQCLAARRAYCATITQIDYSLGLLFARMREMNLLENTWILFTSDHGDMQGDHHMGAKSVFLEGSAHVPMILCPPQGYKDEQNMAGRCYEHPVTLADILPTLLGRADISPPPGVDGMDMLKLFDHPEPDRILFGNSADQFFMVVEGAYKYTWCRAGGTEQLFDLQADPREERELIRAGDHAETAERLRSLLMALLRERNHPAVENDRLHPGPAPSGPGDVAKWPGFHSTLVESDVLH